MTPDYTALVLEKAAPSRLIVAEEFHLLHGAIGLSTEILELSISQSRANNLEELGDVLWYLTFLAHHLNWSPPTTPLPQEGPLPLDDLMVATEDFVSLVKKEVIYSVSQPRLLVSFSALWDAFRSYMAAHHLSLEMLINLNTEKLNLRYKAAFTPEESEDRRDKV